VRADEGEISVEGRKLVGSALLRQGDALLQHGSILLDDDQGMLDLLLPADEARPSATGTIRHALGRRVDVPEVADALFAALHAADVADCSPLGTDARLQADAEAAERIYGSEEWTFRN
jgi:lipoate-protein ligase A